MAVLTRPAARFEQLLERAAQTGLRVNRELGVIKGVRVLGFTSQNGRQYDRRAVERALSMYENLRVNLDHPTRDNPAADRSISSRFGKLRNARLDAGGIRADLFYVRSHPLAEQIAEMAESHSDLLGLSHNCEGRTRRENGTTIVEEILSVRSCDIVADPATSAGLFESRGGRTSGARRFFEAVTKERGGLVEAVELDAPLDADQAAEPTGDADPEDDDLLRAIVSVLTSESVNDAERVAAKIASEVRLHIPTDGDAGAAEPAAESKLVKELGNQVQVLRERLSEIKGRVDIESPASGVPSRRASEQGGPCQTAEDFARRITGRCSVAESNERLRVWNGYNA